MQGQVNIGGECFDNVVITLGKSAINPQEKQYLGDILLIDGAFNLKTGNIEKTKLLEKWLYSTLTEEKKEEEKKEEKKDEEKTSNLNKALSVMEAIATEHKPYSQNPVWRNLHFVIVSAVFKTVLTNFFKYPDQFICFYFRFYKKFH